MRWSRLFNHNTLDPMKSSKDSDFLLSSELREKKSRFQRKDLNRSKSPERTRRTNSSLASLQGRILGKRNPSPSLQIFMTLSLGRKWMLALRPYFPCRLQDSAQATWQKRHVSLCTSGTAMKHLPWEVDAWTLLWQPRAYLASDLCC
jgi:hypothetical protein